jgi:hypothetical protein
MGIGIGLGLVMNPGTGSEVIDFLAGVDPRVTTTSANGTVFDSSGNNVAAATNALRIDVNPLTLAPRGLLTEVSRTNSIRNSQGTGASVGTIGSGGALPSNGWQIVDSGGLSTEIVSQSTVKGFVVTRIRIFGTTSSTNYNLGFESNTQIAALSGQTWALSAYLALAGGSIANITSINLGMSERTAAGAGVVGGNGTDFKGDLTANLARFSYVRTLSGGGTVGVVRPSLVFAFSSGVAVDITLDLAAEQQEQGANVSSYIPTTSAAVTRTLDNSAIDNLSILGFNPLQGTMMVEAEFATIVSGGSQRLFEFNDGTAANRILMGQNGGNLVVNVLNSSVSQATGNAATSITANTIYKAALAWANNDFAWCAQGGTVGTDTSGTVPTVNRLQIGLDNSKLFATNGWIRKVEYSPIRKPNAYLQSWTTP